jgi:hypothetical protein
MSQANPVFSQAPFSPVQVLILYYGAPFPVWVLPEVAAAAIGGGFAVEMKAPE